MRAAASLLGCALALALAFPGAVRAQEMGEQATFADATGLLWGVTSFETWLLAEGIALAASEGCGDENLECALLVAVSSLAAGVSAGVIAGDRDAPPDAPFVWHHAMWGAFSGMALGLGLAGESGEDRGVMAAAGFVLGGAITSLYSWRRRDHLLHDPDAATGAHLMTWGVPLAALVGAIIGAMVDDDEHVIALAVGVATIATYGLAIGLAEN